jgi:hypothetical protein
MPNTTDLKTLYDQLCTSYHAVDDFRAKLLALLPLVSGVAIFQILGKTEVMPFLPAIGIFGAVTGVGLLIYEMKGIQKCTRYIHFGCQIEQELISGGHLTGHFKSLALDRQKKWTYAITEPVASAFVYAAVIGAWVYVVGVKAEYGDKGEVVGHEANLVWPIGAAVVVWIGGIFYWLYCMNSLEDKATKAP